MRQKRDLVRPCPPNSSFLGHVEMLGGGTSPRCIPMKLFSGECQDFHHPGVGKDDVMVLIRHQEPSWVSAVRSHLLFRLPPRGLMSRTLDPPMTRPRGRVMERNRSIPAVRPYHRRRPKWLFLCS